jgi:hypothetical protein
VGLWAVRLVHGGLEFLPRQRGKSRSAPRAAFDRVTSQEALGTDSGSQAGPYDPVRPGGHGHDRRHGAAVGILAADLRADFAVSNDQRWLSHTRDCRGRLGQGQVTTIAVSTGVGRHRSQGGIWLMIVWKTPGAFFPPG